MTVYIILGVIWYILLGFVTLVVWKKTDASSFKDAAKEFSPVLLLITWPVMAAIGVGVLTHRGLNVLLDKF